MKTQRRRCDRHAPGEPSADSNASSATPPAVNTSHHDRANHLITTHIANVQGSKHAAESGAGTEAQGHAPDLRVPQNN